MTRNERVIRIGNPPTYVMFRLLILPQMYALSDDEIEFQVNDRISSMEFLGLGRELSNIPKEYQENPNVLQQKDRDARWIKQNGVHYFSDKNHLSVDVKYGFVRPYAVTDASVDDSQVFNQISNY